MNCPHRKQLTRIDGAGKYYIHCVDCGIDGATHPTVAEAFLHRRTDLADAVALKAAEAAKAGKG